MSQIEYVLAMTQKLLIVSIHDVSPLTWDKVRMILDRLESIGIKNRSLLLIPNFQGKAPIDQAGGEFQSWLQQIQRQDEICLHGYTHQAQEIRGSLFARLMATVYTQREGEFYQLTPEAMRQRLQQGLEHFAKVGLQPTGFIAPAWLLAPGAESILREAGFKYTTRLGSIELFTSASIKKLKAPTLCYSVRNGWRRVLSRLWNPLLFKLSKEVPLLRVAIHPVDIDHPEVFQQILDLLRKAIEVRQVVTYQQMVNSAVLHSGAPIH